MASEMLGSRFKWLLIQIEGCGVPEEEHAAWKVLRRALEGLLSLPVESWGTVELPPASRGWQKKLVALVNAVVEDDEDTFDVRAPQVMVGAWSYGRTGTKFEWEGAVLTERDDPELHTLVSEALTRMG